MIPDRNQLADWNRRQQAARDQYRLMPISSHPICEVCHRSSRNAICDACLRGEIPVSPRTYCERCDRRTWAEAGVCTTCQRKDRA